MAAVGGTQATLSRTALCFELERFEYFPATREVGVLRLSGRWRCPVARGVTPPSLFAGPADVLRATTALPPVASVAAGPDPELWSAGFGASRALVDDPEGRWLLRWSGGEQALPHPVVSVAAVSGGAAGPVRGRARAPQPEADRRLHGRTESVVTGADGMRAQLAHSRVHRASAAAALALAIERCKELEVALEAFAPGAGRARSPTARPPGRVRSTSSRPEAEASGDEDRVAALLLRVARAEARADTTAELDRAAAQRERRRAERLLEIARELERRDMSPPS